MRSWRTTLAGVGQFCAVLGVALNSHFDTLASTVPDWGVVLASGFVMVGLIFTRDHKVSSENAGAHESA